MIYETVINLKNYHIHIEFDTETEEFIYQIKERIIANGTTETYKSNRKSGTKPNSDRSEPDRSEPDRSEPDRSEPNRSEPDEFL